MKLITFFKNLLFLLMLTSSVWANMNSTTWSTSGTTYPALGNIVVGGSNVTVQLQFGRFGNGGGQFPANWTLIGNNLGTITPAIGMSIGYNRTATVQTISLGSSVTNPYLFFNYVDPSTFDFSGYGPSNVKLINTVSSVSGTGLATLANGVVTVNGQNQANDGFVVQLMGTFSS